MLFGCKLSLAMVSTSVSVRSSDRLPSGGTSVEVVGLGNDVDVAAGALELSPLAQATSPMTRLTLMIKRFTPARLGVFGLDY